MSDLGRGLPTHVPFVPAKLKHGARTSFVVYGGTTEVTWMRSPRRVRKLVGRKVGLFGSFSSR
jgi:hypothetical protein